MAVQAVLLLFQSPSPDAEAALRDIQRSHIEANVPDTEEEFRRILQRDLDAYFAQTRGTPVRAEYELLREGPTQSGVSYPKFYLWVRIVRSGELVESGAVRVAAVDKVRIDVTSFTAESQIRKAPDSLYDIFPGPVADGIRERLGIAGERPGSKR